MGHLFNLRYPLRECDSLVCFVGSAGFLMAGARCGGVGLGIPLFRSKAVRGETPTDVRLKTVITVITHDFNIVCA